MLHKSKLYILDLDSLIPSTKYQVSQKQTIYHLRFPQFDIEASTKKKDNKLVFPLLLPVPFGENWWP
ncbi:hypothetical protein LguiB_034191 [Lonicera macranthoides]